MNRHLLLLALCQGLFLTNNVVFIAINGLVGLQLAPSAWMATLPLTAYVAGGAAQVSAEQRVEEMTLQWIGNTQISPTLLGYIEGAPPVPSETRNVTT